MNYGLIFKVVGAILIFTTTSVAETEFAKKLVRAAESQIGVTKSYDPTYVRLKFPGGDVPKSTGVCSDVIIRAYREVGIDLQKNVNEDMQKAFKLYPRKWGLRSPDSNIDHRRVPNLMFYFSRFGKILEKSRNPKGYQEGDIVAWDLGGGITHIGIVAIKNSEPWIIHNIGNGAQEEDRLFEWKIIGHYAYPQ